MANSIITALFGLFGVLIGGWISSTNQAKERKHNRIREQIDNFYSPLLGIRMKILAKSETRLKVSGAASQAWNELMKRTDNYSIEDRIRVDKERFPDFERVIDENNRRFIEEILPLYKELMECFSANIGYAESSSRKYFGELAEFVEIWDRWLNNTIPKEALKFLGHSEDKLQVFYKDLSKQLEKLSNELKE